MEHYFSERQKTGHERLKIQENIRGTKFNFLTDKGVFSRKGIDNGTKLLTESIELNEEDTVLDIGCGYGVIGIVLSRNAKKVYMVEINRRAVHLARKNAKLNECCNTDIKKGDFFETKLKNFDLVVTNPPLRMGKEYVFKIIERVLEILNEKGRFYTVVRTKQGAKSYRKKIKRVFGNCETVNKGSGYRVFKGVKC